MPRGFLNGLVQADLTSGYTRLIDYNGGTNATYIGDAEPGTSQSTANWRIQLIQYDGNNNPTSVTWAGGTANFESIWANRATLTYS